MHKLLTTTLLLAAGLLLAAPGQAQTTDICDRTDQVETAIIGALLAELTITVTDCATVDDANLAAITALDVSDQTFGSLDAGDFAGLDGLEILDLSDNTFSALPATVFSGLSALASLNISNNSLTSLPEELFTGLDALQVLALTNNALVTLQPMSNLTNLHTLLLSYNDLTSAAVDEAITAAQSNLRVLTLNNNELDALPAALSSFTQLQQLNLEINDIAALPANVFDGLNQLLYLGLNYNAITSVASGVFDQLDALNRLTLKGARNTLGTIPNNLLTPLLDTLTILERNQSTALPIRVNYAANSASDPTEGRQMVLTFTMDRPVPLYDLNMPYSVELTGSQFEDWISLGEVQNPDCAAPMDGFVYFPAGATSSELTFCPIADGVPELGESISITARRPVAVNADGAPSPFPADIEGQPANANFPDNAAVRFKSTTEAKLVSRMVADGAPPLVFVSEDIRTDQTYSVAHALGGRNLPYALGGAGELTYSLTGAIPPGLSFGVAEDTTVDDSVTPPITLTFNRPRLRGIPTTFVDTTPLTFTVNDESSPPMTKSLVFNITVKGVNPRFPGSASVPNLAVERFQPIRAVTLPEALGGTGTLSYTLTPTPIPSELTFTPTTRVLHGRVLNAGVYELTYTAIDENSKIARQIFRLKAVNVSGTGGICDRSVPIQEAILNALEKLDSELDDPDTERGTPSDKISCSEVTPDDLETVKHLDASGGNLSNGLKSGDLDGLGLSLRTLNLSNTSLSARPDFSALKAGVGGRTTSALRTLDLSDNNQDSFDEGMFTGLDSLAFLNMSGSNHDFVAAHMRIADLTDVMDTLTEVHMPDLFPVEVRIGVTGLDTGVNEGSVRIFNITRSSTPSPTAISVPYIISFGGGASADDFATSDDPGSFNQRVTDNCTPAETGVAFIPAEVSAVALTFCLKADNKVESDEIMTFVIDSPRLAGPNGLRAKPSVSSALATFDRTTLAQTMTLPMVDRLEFDSPSFGTAKLIFSADGEYKAVRFPYARGGSESGAPSYALTSTPPFPNGNISFCSTCSPPVLETSPTVAEAGEYALTYTATRGSDSVTRYVTLLIHKPMVFEASPAFPSETLTYTVGEEMTPVSLPLVDPGTGLLLQSSKVEDPDDPTFTRVPEITFQYILHDGQSQIEISQITKDEFGRIIPPVTLSPLLPARLVLNTLDGANSLRGTPQKSAVGLHDLRYRAIDSSSDLLEQRGITIRILPLDLSFDAAEIPDQSYATGVRIPRLQLPTATGTGTGTLTYTLDGVVEGLFYFNGDGNEDGNPNLPPTLSRFPAAGAEGDYSLTFTVTDSAAAPLSRSLTFMATVEQGDLVFKPGSQADQTYIINTEIDDLVLPDASGGAPEFTFTLGGAPTGLSFTAATRTLSGMPDTLGASNLTFTVRDADGTEESLTFVVAVMDPPSLTLDSTTQADQTYIATEDIPDLVLPDASGGAPEYTFTLGGAPTSLSFTATTRTLSGAPDTAGESVLTFTVRDAEGTEASLTFAATVLAAGSLALNPATQADQSYIADTEIPELVLPKVIGGTSPYTFTLEGAPADLSFTAGTFSGTLSGTPSAAAASESALTYKVRDAGGIEASLTFNISITVATATLVFDAAAETALGVATGGLTFIGGEEVNFTLPAASGATGAISYTLLDAAAASREGNHTLTFTSATRVLQGTSRIYDEQIALTYSATDDSAAVSLTFLITMQAPAPDFSPETLQDQVYTVGALVSLTLPEASNTLDSEATFGYTLAPDLEGSGLTYSAADRVLAGAPTAALTATEATYTATQENLDYGGGVNELKFNITINEAPALSFDPAEVPDQTFLTGATITALELPTASGGISAYTYTLGGTIPADLSFYNGDSDDNGVADATPTLTGTLSAAAEASPLTFTVSDSASPTAITLSLTFSVTVNAPEALAFTPADVADQTFLTGGIITALSLPTASGGVSAYTYTLGGAPTGLTFNDGDSDDDGVPDITPTLSGAATADTAATPLTFSVTDSASPTAATLSLTFTVTVNAPTTALLTLNPATLSDQTYTTGATITALQLPTGLGGEPEYSYTLGGTLPTGLSFAGDIDQPAISGTPDTATANTQLVYTVIDSTTVPLSAALTFHIFVAAPPVLTQGDLTYTAGFPLQDLPTPPTLPQITSGGIAPISYAVGGLPANLSFDSASRTLTGAASAADSSALTFSATDSNNALATATFTLTINAPLTFTEQSGSHQVRSGETYRIDLISLSLDPPLTLPAFGGGDNSLSGVLTGPAGDTDLGGLVFTPATRILSGVLRSQSDGGDYVWTVTDGSGAFASLTFTLSAGGPYFEAQQSDLTFAQGEQGSATLLEANTAQAQPDVASVVYTLGDPNGSPLTSILPGLSFDPATRTLSGTPTAGRNPTALSYTVTDGDGNIDVLIFNVSVIALPLGFTGSVPDQSYIVNVPIEALPLPLAQDGIAGYRYSLSGSPAGLIFNVNANPPTISGAPADDTEGNYSLTFTVTDSAAGTPATASLTFNMNIVPLIFIPDSIADQSFIIGAPVSLTLPTAAGGSSPYAYTLADLPVGLTLQPNGGTQQDPPTISGIPEDGAEGEHNLIYTVTDSNSPASHSLSLSFTVTVEAPTVLILNPATLSDQTYTTGAPITALQLPIGLGGEPEYTYSLGGTLPSGLTFTDGDSNNDGVADTIATLTGLPTSEVSDIPLTFTVTDSASPTPATVSLTFSVTVNAPEALAFTPAEVADQTYITGGFITALELPIASGGISAYSYTLGGAPAGLTFNDGDSNSDGVADTTPTLTGAATADTAATPLTFSVTDSASPTAATLSLTFTVTVNAPTVLILNPATLSDQSFTSGAPITALRLPTGLGGEPAYTYTLGGDIPSGLTFTDGDSNNDGVADTPATLIGTPISAVSDIPLTFTITDSATPAAATVNLTFNVSVTVLPLGFAGGVADQSYVVNVPIPILNLPLARSGTPAYSYTLDGIPVGLSFDPTIRTLSGTPADDTEGNYKLSYTVTDSTTGVPATASLTFNINIVPLVFVPGSIADQTFTIGTPATLVLPTAIGGTSPYAYTLADLPPGLTFQAQQAPPTLIGTPEDGARSNYNLTYTVTDSNSPGNHTLSLIFKVTVNAPGVLAFTPAEVADQTYTTNVAITALQLPTASGGRPAYTYTLGGALPTGLTYYDGDSNSDGVADATPTLSGAATAEADAIPLTFLVTDSASPTPATLSLTFTVTVSTLEALAFTPATVADQSYATGVAIETLTLPTVSGGMTPYTHAFSAAPDGLSFDTSATPPMLVGTPQLSAVGTHALTYTVTDRASASASLIFNVVIELGLLPDLLFDPSTVADQIYATGADIAPLTLPVVTGGVGALSYTLQDAPGGLNFDTATRILSGAPAAISSAQQVIYTATDSAPTPRSLSLTFQITVNGVAERTPAVQTAILRQLSISDADAVTSADLATITTLPLESQSITTLQPSDFAGLIALQNLNISGNGLQALPTALFAGLQELTFLDLSNNGLRSLPQGIFGETAAPAQQSATQTRAASDFVTAQTATDLSKLVHLDLSNNDLEALQAGVFDNLDSLTTLRLNGNTNLNTLPAGLFSPVLDTLTSLDITGVPNTATPAEMRLSGPAERILREGRSEVLRVELTPPLPLFHVRVAYSVTLGDGATAADLRTGDGCTAPVDGFVLLAPGAASTELTFCAATDTQDEAEERLTLSLSANGASPAATNGNPAHADVSSQLPSITRHASENQVRITLTGPPLAFSPNFIADQRYIVEAPIPLLQLPLARGGVGAKRYRLSGSVPAGLEFNAAPAIRTLSGTPEEDTVGEYTLTYTATDSASTPSSVQLVFRITITPGVDHFTVINRVLLPEIARAITDQNISAITERISRVRNDLRSNGTASPTAEANLGGQNTWAGLLHNHGLTLLKGEQLNGRNILSSSDFVLPLNTNLAHDETTEARSAGLFLWGSGSYRDLEGSASEVDWNGELVGAHLGLDTLIRERLLAGLAISRNRSDLDYDFEEETGAHQVTLTNLNPYFGWASENGRLEAWGTISYGQGELEIDDDNIDVLAISDVEMFSLGAGLRGAVLDKGSKMRLHLRGDAMQSRLEVDNSENIEEIAVEAIRLRVALEASSAITLVGGSRIEPLLELGVRYDGADGKTRSAIELAAGLRHNIPLLGLTLESRLYTLVGAENYSEHGAQASLQLDPGLGKGLSLNLSSGYGPEAPATQQIWQQDLNLPTDNDNPNTPTPTDFHLNARLGYNIPTNTLRHRTLLTPYTELKRDGETTTNTLGLNWQLPSATLQLEWMHKDHEAPETELKAQLRF